MQNSATEARSSVYRLLAGLFARELTAENIVAFQAGSGRQLLDALEKVEAYTPITAGLKSCFAQMAKPAQAALDLAESYAWSFHGVGGPHAAPLYASVYLSNNKSTHQEVERDLSKIIGEQGLSFANSDKEPYDHLSVILEFVAWLDEKEESVQRQAFTQELRREIIEKYLLSWLPDFARRCKQADRLGFYSGLATETLAFVVADFKHIRQEKRSAALDSGKA